MGKQKVKTTEKKTAEFILRTRPQDDPDYNNPNVPQNVLVYVPKENDDENTQITLDKIPESIRRDVLDEETEGKLLREKLGIEEKPQNLNKKSQKIPDLIKCDEHGNAEEDFSLEEDEEMINTNIKSEFSEKKKEKEIKFKQSEKIEAKKKEIDNLNLKDLLSGNKEKFLEIDDKTLEMLLTKSKAKFNAEFIEYNEYGLKKDINPEILEYVTNKKFKEGTDLFIPAPNYEETMYLQENRVDYDIDPEKMDDEYKEVFNLLKDDAFNENENEAKDNYNEEDDVIESCTNGGLEDDFILLANEGKLPIELVEKEIPKKEEVKIIDIQKNEPSYKYITKEEKELLDKKFMKTYDKHYKDKDQDDKEEFEDFPDDEENENEKKFAKQKKIDMNSKEFNQAINQVLPKHKRIEVNSGKKNEENEEEEYEDFEEEEEFEDFDENLLNDDYMKKQGESDLKYSDKIVVQEKKGAKAAKGPKTKTEILGKKFKVISKKQIEEEETIEDLEKYLYSKEVYERDFQAYNNAIAREEKEENEKKSGDGDSDYELNYAKKYLDITSVGASYGNMPKVVEIEGDIKKYEKRLRKEERLKIEKELKEKEKEILKENEKNKKDKFDKMKMGKKDKKKLNEFIEKDDNDIDEDLEFDEVNFEKDKETEKEENKMRKKILKEEKREKRKVKKEIKTAFKVI